MVTRISSGLEKPISQYFLKKWRGVSPIRCQILGCINEKLHSELITVLKNHADCFFMNSDDEDNSHFSLCRIDDVHIVLEEAVKRTGVVSFYFDDGALTFSADLAADGRSNEFHLMAWGLLQDGLRHLAIEFEGLIY